VPKQWTRFAGRTSLVSGQQKRADRPANAILNYLYGLLEVEAVLACHAVSLDPGLPPALDDGIPRSLACAAAQLSVARDSSEPAVSRQHHQNAHSEHRRQSASNLPGTSVLGPSHLELQVFSGDLCRA
jgi:hypothetical protein